MKIAIDQVVGTVSPRPTSHHLQKDFDDLFMSLNQSDSYQDSNQAEEIWRMAVEKLGLSVSKCRVYADHGFCEFTDGSVVKNSV